jgi:hypothetical protein
MICNPSRTAALDQLSQFISIAGLYERDRNYVKPGHSSVSKLSPAIRHRLITEQEVMSAVLRIHPFGRVEKYIQEVYWRRYWKSWLALRPEVWSDFLGELANLPKNATAQRVENSQSGNSVIDHFAAELVSTGYLHNHSRMWFAAWWVHAARLPWQLGAAFFYRHLLDGDPASNTLSWRWVAGLQTAGKTYLARRSNLEKYLASPLLHSLAAGLEAFESPQAVQPETASKPSITRKSLPMEYFSSSPTTGLWVHEEDLSVEFSPLGSETFCAIIVAADADNWERYQFPLGKRQWIAAALQDAAARAGLRWKAPITTATAEPMGKLLVAWAKANSLDQIAAMRPEIGPLNDSLPGASAALAEAGVRLVLVDRPEDLSIRHFAGGGFFQFWERLRKTLVN